MFSQKMVNHQQQKNGLLTSQEKLIQVTWTQILKTFLVGYCLWTHKLQRYIECYLVCILLEVIYNTKHCDFETILCLL